MNNKNNLKIAFIGFDWRDIGIEERMSKLNRDGLQTERNEFLLLYAGNKIERKVAKKSPKFIVWHFSFLLKFRIFYDLFFIIFFPLVLIFERYKPDIFYLSDFPLVLASIIPAKILRSQIIFRLNNLPRDLAKTKGRKGKIFSAYYWIVEKIAVKFINKFVVINETTKRYLLDLGVREEKIFIDVPDTIVRDKDYIKRADKNYIREKYNIAEDKKILLSVGSLIKEKGFDELIKTLAEIGRNDIVLIICGEGREQENLKELSKKICPENRVIFAGNISRDKIWHYYIGADIFALFTKSESLGMVFWEAMHAGIPVIGKKVSGVAETIGRDGERGFYWMGDINGLRGKINFCLNDKDHGERQGLIDRAKKYVSSQLNKKININEIYNQ